MSMKKRIGVVLILFVVLCLTLTILVVTGVLSPSFCTRFVESEADTSADAFVSYEYIEQHQNGSYTNIGIYKNSDDGSYYMVQSYKDVGGQFMYQTFDLDSDSVERWNGSLRDFKVVDVKESESEGFYTRGILTFSTKSGSSSYDVVPLDVSGYGGIDPWAKKDTIQMVSGVSASCNQIFPVSDMKDMLHIDSQPQLGAYLNMLAAELSDKLSTDDVQIAVSDIKRVTLGSKTDDMYILNVESSAGSKKFSVAMNGHILAEK